MQPHQILALLSCDTALLWCKCGVNQIIPQEIENKCCAQQKCMTTHTRFSKFSLDPEVLQLAIRNTGGKEMTAPLP